MKWSAPPPPLNPLYSDNRLKLGVFGANVSNRLRRRRRARTSRNDLAERRRHRDNGRSRRLRALVPVARWKGFGGATNFNGDPLLTQPGQRLAGNVST